MFGFIKKYKTKLLNEALNSFFGYESQVHQSDILKEELTRALWFIHDAASDLPCDAEYAPDCTACCADDMLNRSLYYQHLLSHIDDRGSLTKEQTNAIFRKYLGYADDM